MYDPRVVLSQHVWKLKRKIMIHKKFYDVYLEFYMACACAHRRFFLFSSLVASSSENSTLRRSIWSLVKLLTDISVHSVIDRWKVSSLMTPRHPPEEDFSFFFFPFPLPVRFFRRWTGGGGETGISTLKIHHRQKTLPPAFRVDVRLPANETKSKLPEYR